MPEIKVNHSQTLAKTPIFSGLTEAELSFLARRAFPRHFSAGETVFGEGEPCAGLYVVESGHIRIFKSSASGREQVLSIDGPGNSVGELPVFDGGNYPASVAAIDDATLLFVSTVAEELLPEADPLLGLRPTPSQRATVKYFFVVAALWVVQVGLGALTAHYGVEGSGFYGIPLDRWLPYSVTRAWHLQIGLFWIATSWLATGLYVAPAVSGVEPKGQRLSVNLLFGALIFVVVGSLAGEWMSTAQAWPPVVLVRHSRLRVRGPGTFLADSSVRRAYFLVVGDVARFETGTHDKRREPFAVVDVFAFEYRNPTLLCSRAHVRTA